MRRILSISMLALIPTGVWAGAPGDCVTQADFTCPAGSDRCAYVVKTEESDPVSGGGGHTCDCSQAIIAPAGQYFKDPPTMQVVSENSTKKRECGVRDRTGIQTRRIPIPGTGSTVEVTFVKKYLIRTHVETGSGPGSEGKTCHIHCGFTGEVVDLPK